MAKAFDLLFTKSYNGKLLFRRQSELVYDLLSTKGSAYYILPDEKDKFDREFVRLKTLVSQLLSSSVSRNVPPAFSESLKIVIDRKLENSELTEQIVNDILADLRVKNELSRQETRQSSTERLASDFASASYISIVTANPLEIESSNLHERFSLRNLFINDFLNFVSKRDYTRKKYRILLPLESSCHLFWKGLKEIVFNYLRSNRDNEFLIKSLFNQLNFEKEQSELFSLSYPTDDYLERLTDLLLTFLNNTGVLVVFSHTSPLFNLPTIAIDPADNKNSKIFVLLEADREEPIIHAYSLNETILWRFFVWDRIKTKQYSGKRIDFVTSLKDVGDF